MQKSTSAPKPKLLGSAPTKEGIVQVIAEFYYGATITLRETPDRSFDIHNSLGLIQGTRVVVKRGRYHFVARGS